jgi:glycosyltransferase involved in cell wall biosynthesis
MHTVLGACYAARLEEEEVEHIHVHHGFSASWIAMVAARLLGVDFSMTLHGSDLLLHQVYLDVKLQNCKFCLTVSEYNRQFIARHYPEIELKKAVIARLGVEVPESGILKEPAGNTIAEPFRMLAVGRLHPVKDHAFLVRSCAQLQARGLEFHCDLAGDGPERRRLESLIRELNLEERITLLGYTTPEQTDSLYRQADLVVLTSRSEGIPLVLMEAMARGKLVLAPAITGIPELVIPGRTGFLYAPGSMRDFLEQLTKISCFLGKASPSMRDAPENGCARDVLSRTDPTEPCNHLDQIRHAARLHVLQNFNRTQNLQLFTELFLERVGRPASKDLPHASSLLQQI